MFSDQALTAILATDRVRTLFLRQRLNHTVSKTKIVLEAEQLTRYGQCSVNDDEDL